MRIKKQHKIFGVVLISIAASVVFLYLLEKDSYSSEIGKFKNGQEYLTFKSEDIELKYPNWAVIEKSRLLLPDKIKLSVSNNNCAFVINAEPFSDNNTLTEFAEQYMQERIIKLGSRIVNKQINNSSSYLEEELHEGIFTYRSFTRIYLTSYNNFYKIYVIGEKSGFTKACLPILEELFGSIKVK